MPLTQSRFLAILNIADELFGQLTALRELAQTFLERSNALALARQAAQQTARDLPRDHAIWTAIEQYEQAIAGFANLIQASQLSPTQIRLFETERAHFLANAKRNAASAARMRAHRQTRQPSSSNNSTDGIEEHRPRTWQEVLASTAKRMHSGASKEEIHLAAEKWAIARLATGEEVPADWRRNFHHSGGSF